jgi:hypothetical protein
VSPRNSRSSQPCTITVQKRLRISSSEIIGASLSAVSR